MSDEHTTVEYVGPFPSHDVVVDGRAVPFLTATLVDGGRIDLALDRRFGLVLTVAEAERFVPFLAHAIAVGCGYTAHPEYGQDGPTPRHPFPRMTQLEGTSDD